MISISEKELSIIEYQLGRNPDNLVDVAIYCPFKKPAVLLTEPYNKKQGVFPTLYWLSCPYLVKKVARLEDKGLVKKFSTMVKEDKALRKRLILSHQQYARRRLELLPKEVREELEANSMAIFKVLKDTGIGGIRNLEGVKCLHTHLADYFVNKENPIGELVWGMVHWPTDCHICDWDKVKEWKD